MPNPGGLDRALKMSLQRKSKIHSAAGKIRAPRSPTPAPPRLCRSPSCPGWHARSGLHRSGQSRRRSAGGEWLHSRSPPPARRRFRGKKSGSAFLERFFDFWSRLEMERGRKWRRRGGGETCRSFRIDQCPVLLLVLSREKVVVVGREGCLWLGLMPACAMDLPARFCCRAAP